MTTPKSTPAWGAPQVEHWTAVRQDLARALRGLPPDPQFTEEGRARLEREILTLIFTFALDWGKDVFRAERRLIAGRTRSPRRAIPRAVRRFVRQRDGNRCGYCRGEGTRERGPDGRVWHIDHRQAVARGGTDEAANLLLACKTCNLRKHTRSAEDFAALLADGKGRADAPNMHSLRPSTARGD